MEIATVAARERRKRVHSTKCPCCLHEQGKPELKPKHSRKRKGNEIKPENAPLLKTKRYKLTKSVKNKTSSTLKSADSELSSSDLKEQNLNIEARVLRSGRSTPVNIENSNDKEKPASQKKTKQRKSVKHKVATDSDGINSSFSGIKTEQETDSLDENNATTPISKSPIKGKSKRAQQKVDNPKSRPCAKSQKARKSSCAKQKERKVTKTRSVPKTAKQKVPTHFSKVTKNKLSQMAKTKGSNLTAIATPKKTSAIEKLKVRAFDQLKEKLEIAFDRSSISVPECAQLLQQITSPDLSEIFDSQPASVDEGSSDSLVAGLAGKSLPEIMTEGMQRSESATNKKEKLVAEKTITKEKAVADNLSKAAQALVSFKIQASNTGGSRISLKSPSLEPSNTTDTSIASVAHQQTGTVNNFTSTTAFGQEKLSEKLQEYSTVHSTAEQLTVNQELQTGNLPQDVSPELIVSSGSIVKATSTTEPSSAGLSSTNFCFSTTNQLLEKNPLIPATKQLLQTANPLILTNNQLLQTTSSIIPTVSQLLQTNSFLPSTSALIPTTEVLTSFPKVSAIAASKTDTTLVAISPGLPVVQAQNLLNPSQLAFQVIQGQSQVTSPTIPAIITSTQPTPRLICPNPTTLPRNTTASNNQRPTTVNQQLFLPAITPPLDQKTLGSNLPTIAPAIKKPHDLLLSTTTNHVAGTISTTSTNESVSSCKLRPILPREPLVSPAITIFNRPQQTLQKINVGKASDISSNVKQAVKRLVNGRTRNSDNPSPQKTISLPDIASTFNKSIFTVNSNSKVMPTLAPAQNTQEFSELANKEQAIKALLSIGSEQQVLRQGAKGTNKVEANKVSETKNTEDLLVVFDTCKGIFKVDDVTIDPEVNTIGKESYTCGKCGKIFTSLSYLARHIKRVCPDMTHRKWKCDHCDKAFRHPFGLQQHVFTHTGERPHKCSQCPKAFYSSNDLRRHSRIHSGERPYKCKHCGKTFATTISLKTHTFIHTGEKPHRCPHCPKTFATSSKLGRHIVTHSEQRPYCCPHCPKTFNRSGDLRRHKQTLHDEKIPAGVQDVQQNDSKDILNVSQDVLSNVTAQ